jgi:hypothetical protein
MIFFKNILGVSSPLISCREMYEVWVKPIHALRDNLGLGTARTNPSNAIASQK